MVLGLRWTLGALAAVAACGWVALAVAGGALVVTSLVSPDRRALLHVVAALMLAIAAGSALLARESVVVAALGALYAGAWLWYYARVLRP